MIEPRPLLLIFFSLGVLVLAGCQGSAPIAAPASPPPSINPDRVERGVDGFGEYPTLNDEVVCHTSNGHLTTWQTPRTYDWDRGEAGGALAGNRNRGVRASEPPDLFATFVSGTAKAYDDRIEFYDYRIEGNNLYTTQSKDSTIVLNGTLHCTVFVDEAGTETRADLAASMRPTTTAPDASSTSNTPAEVATEYYQTQGRGDYEGTCALIDPEIMSADSIGECAAGFAQIYQMLPDPELSAFLSTYVLGDDAVTISGDTAEVVVAPGPKWNTTTTLALIRRSDGWYVDWTLGF